MQSGGAASSPVPQEEMPQSRGVDNNERACIKSLYCGARVLVTGASGFLGKVLIESLLRKTEVDKIYILIRSKRNKTPEERMKEILNSTVFTKLRSDNPRRLSAIVPITGDVALPDLGLSQEGEDRLIQEVEIVFHSAATVLFNENLKLAVEINVRGTTGILDLARRMRKLKVFMHVSTAYSNYHLSEIDEKIYPCEDGTDVIKMAESLNYETAHNITKVIIGNAANTYTYTKRAAEDLIDKHYRDMPIGIFRPAIVAGALKEPIPGFVDSQIGPVRMLIGVMTGLVHCITIRRSVKIDLVPVDMVTNCLISAAWDTYNRYHMNEKEWCFPIYNVVSPKDVSTTWGDLQDSTVRFGRRSAPSSGMWYPFVFPTTSWGIYRLTTSLLHFLPAFLSDMFLVFSGKKQKYVKLYKKVDVIVMEVLKPFCNSEWVFRTGNVLSLWERMSAEERELFPFTWQGFDWPGFTEIYLKGIKQFVLKDSLTEKAGEEKATRYLSYGGVPCSSRIPGFRILYHNSRVCLEHEATRAATPCGHLQLCKPCIGDHLNNVDFYKIIEDVPTDVPLPVTCLICRALVGNYVRIFI